MSAEIITLPVTYRPPPNTVQKLSPRARRRMKALAEEWGVSLETAVVMMVTAYIDAEGGK